MNGALVRRIFGIAATIAILVALWALAIRIPRTLSVFLIAAFIAFGAAPLVRRLERRLRAPRAVAISIVYLVLLGALVLLALVIVPTVYAQALVLVQQAPEVASAAERLTSNVLATLHNSLGRRVVFPTADQIEAEVGAAVTAALAGAAGSIGGIVFNTLSALLVGASAIILSVFFLIQGRDVRAAILGFSPPSKRDEVAILMTEVAEVFGHFVAGQALLSAVVGVAVWLALFPAHFGFALLVGVVCGLGYAVPFAGMVVAQIVAALLALPQGPGMVAYVSIAIFVISRIADNVLVPKIMADSVGVSPIAVMFAVFAGGELFGLPGLILGIPAAALIRLLFSHFVRPWLTRMQRADVLAHPEIRVDVTVDHDGPGPLPPETVEVVIPARPAAG